MKKILKYLGFISLTTLLVSQVALAKNDKDFAPASEEATVSGTYDVPNHPGMKLHVHVYRAKNNSKPTNTIGPLVCNLDNPNSSSVTGLTGWHLPTSVTYRLNRS